MEKEIIDFNVYNEHIKINSININNLFSYRNIHFHKETEFIYVKSGTIICTVEDESLKISKGQIIIINSNSVHRIFGIEQTAQTLFLQVDLCAYLYNNDNDYLSILNLLYNYSSSNNYYIFDNKSELYEILNKIIIEYNSNLQYNNLYIKSYIYNIIAFLFRNKIIGNTKEMSSKKILRILPAIKYVNVNYKSFISLENISAMLNIDKSYFCRLFKSAVGYTFSEYLNFVRVYNATLLIRDTDLNILEIAYECGFCSTQYFGKQFKKFKNMSPYVFKKNLSAKK